VREEYSRILCLSFKLRSTHIPSNDLYEKACDKMTIRSERCPKNPNGKPRVAWTALDPSKTRIIARRYAKDNMPELIRLTKAFREKRAANPDPDPAVWRRY
jgi:hypothetical protein